MELLINIDVPDLGNGIAFYERGLGLSFRRYLFDRSIGEMSLGPVRIFLIERRSGSVAVATAEQLRDYADHWTPVHLDVVVDDLQHATERALLAGARSWGSVAAHDWGRLREMRDPFGHGFCLIEFHADDYAPADRSK